MAIDSFSTTPDMKDAWEVSVVQPQGTTGPEVTTAIEAPNTTADLVDNTSFNLREVAPQTSIFGEFMDQAGKALGELAERPEVQEVGKTLQVAAVEPEPEVQKQFTPEYNMSELNGPTGPGGMA